MPTAFGVGEDATRGFMYTPVILPRQRILSAFVPFVEMCGVVVVLLLLTQGILPLLLHGSADVEHPESGMPLKRIAYWCYYAFTMVLVVLRPRDFVRCAAKAPFPAGMVLLALLSASWSLDPNETLRRAFALGMATAFGLCVASRFRSHDLLRLVACVLGICALLSVAFGLLLPSYGIASGVFSGDWEGVFTHKNTLGAMMLIAVVTFRSVPNVSRRSQLVGWIGVGVAAILVVLSRSMTALVGLGGGGLAVPLLRRFRQGRLMSALVLLAVSVLCATVIFMSVDMGVTLRMMGRDATLTGRTGIWSAVVDRIIERPLLGYGYGAFWRQIGGPGERVRQVVQWPTPDAHNSYLDFGADLGLVGVLALIGVLAHAGQRVWRHWRPALGTTGDWFLAFVIVIVLIDFTVSFLYGSFFAWAMLVTMTAATPDGGPSPSTSVAFLKSC